MNAICIAQNFTILPWSALLRSKQSETVMWLWQVCLIREKITRSSWLDLLETAYSGLTVLCNI